MVSAVSALAAAAGASGDWASTAGDGTAGLDEGAYFNVIGFVERLLVLMRTTEMLRFRTFLMPGQLGVEYLQLKDCQNKSQDEKLKPPFLSRIRIGYQAGVLSRPWTMFSKGN